MKKKLKSSSEKETKDAAAEVARDILSRKGLKKAIVVALSGDLGAGKTVFTKGFLSFMGVKSRVISPTFVISKRYAISKSAFRNVYHMDCYRISDPKELETIGLKNIIKEPENIILIEWPENAGRLSPDIRVSITHLPEENSRLITISYKK